MDQSLGRLIGTLTSSKAFSTYAGILIGGVIFLVAAWWTGHIFQPGDPLSRERNEAFLADHAKETGVTVTPSGLQIRVIKPGTGDKPRSDKATVKVNYVGKFINGHVFDSSVERGQPAEFPLDNVIAGWTEGLQMMRVGEKAELVVPYKLAYGEEGRGSDMPGYQTLVFEVELLEVK